jgi:hypothetical protein
MPYLMAEKGYGMLKDALHKQGYHLDRLSQILIGLIIVFIILYLLMYGYR